MKAALVAASLASLFAYVLYMGTVKVRNELKMTRAYDRQAAALERIADAAEVKKSAPRRLNDIDIPPLPGEVPCSGGSYQDHLSCKADRAGR